MRQAHLYLVVWRVPRGTSCVAIACGAMFHVKHQYLRMCTNVSRLPGRRIDVVTLESSKTPFPPSTNKVPFGANRAVAVASESFMLSTARIAITSKRLSGGMASIRFAQTSVGRLRVRMTSRRNVAFFPWDSPRVTFSSGRRSWIGSPGKPAPEPKSSNVVAGVRSGARWMPAKRLSPKWRRTISSGSRMAVRLVRAFHLRRRSR